MSLFRRPVQKETGLAMISHRLKHLGYRLVERSLNRGKISYIHVHDQNFETEVKGHCTYFVLFVHEAFGPENPLQYFSGRLVTLRREA